MKFSHSFVVAAVFGFICFEASAQTKDLSTAESIRRDAPKGITRAFYTCIDKADSDSDHLALDLCLTDEKKLQNNRLNAVYKSVLGKLNAQDKDGLISAERTWLAFHRKSEDIESSLYGGDSDTVSRSESGFDIELHVIYRLCERANTLDKYLYIANKL
jgi:uncharacterized protein YecT (DUF1311 family)